MVVVLALQLLASGNLYFRASIFIINMTGIIIPATQEKTASVKFPSGVPLYFAVSEIGNYLRLLSRESA